jgi:hypothetical protein
LHGQLVSILRFPIDELTPYNFTCNTAVPLSALATPCRASDIVTIDAKYKQDSVSAPDPGISDQSAAHPRARPGLYRPVLNQKTGMADEVKVLKRTGYREADASAVMTLFKWNFGRVRSNRETFWLSLI